MKCRHPLSRVLLAAFFLFAALPAPALIMVGVGNDPVNDAGWPLGALDVANLKSRVGWWEGPPFGGGEWCFMYRGDTAKLEEAIKAFSAVRAPSLQIVLHRGPMNSQFLGNQKNAAAADTHYDWSFTVWRPESWHRLYNDPRSTFAADQPNFRKPVDPPRLDVYLTDKLDWKKITVPQGVQLIDDRGAGAAKPGAGCALRGDVFDMATGKPVAGAQVRIERQAKDGKWEKLATATVNATGRYEALFAPGRCRIVASAQGYAPRMVAYQEFKDGDARKQVIELAPATRLTGTVTDPDAKPLAGVQVSATNTMGIDGRGYPPPDRVQVKTDANGRFTLDDLPTGYTQLWVVSPGWYHTDTLKLYASPEPKGVALKMVATGTIKGKVVDARGQAVTGGTISVSPPGDPIGKWGGSMNLAADGTFEFDQVPPGPYTVSTQPQYPGARPDPNAKEIRVESHKTVEVTVKR
jgi:hypothetical protein